MYVLEGPVCFCWFESAGMGIWRRYGDICFPLSVLGVDCDRWLWCGSGVVWCGVMWRSGYSSVGGMNYVEV